MMGLKELKAASRNPKRWADSGMSDGQQRRNDKPPSADWSAPADHATLPADNIATMQLNPKLIGDQRLPHLQQDTKSVIFEGTLLVHVLQQRVDDAERAKLRLLAALREARLGNPDVLSRTMRNVLNHEPELAIAMHVEILSKQIDIVSPDVIGYRPSAGIDYALAPIKRTVKAIVAAFKQADE